MGGPGPCPLQEGQDKQEAFCVKSAAQTCYLLAIHPISRSNGILHHLQVIGVWLAIQAAPHMEHRVDESAELLGTPSYLGCLLALRVFLNTEKQIPICQEARSKAILPLHHTSFYHRLFYQRLHSENSQRVWSSSLIGVHGQDPKDQVLGPRVTRPP